MNNNIGGNNNWALKQLLWKKFQDLMNTKYNKEFRHDFTKADPVLRVSFELTEGEFSAFLMQVENSNLKKRISRLEKRIRELEGKNPSELLDLQEAIDAKTWECPDCDSVNDVSEQTCPNCGV